jgi:hypothetical protein
MTIDCKYRELERGEIYKRGWDGTGKLTALTPEAFIQPYLDPHPHLHWRRNRRLSTETIPEAGI